jgi:hypothetical protein
MSKQTIIFDFLKKKTDFTKKIKINKEMSKKIFYIFSILLIFDIFILPIAVSIIFGNYECNYDIILCLGLSIIPLLLFGFFWCIIWFGIYESFFMSEVTRKKIRNSKFFIARLKLKNIDYIASLHGKDFIKKQSVLMVTIFCFAIGYYFLFQLYQIINLTVISFKNW